MSRNIFVNILLLLIFILLTVIAVFPFIAEISFNIGNTLNSKYRWKTADEKFDLAIWLDPLSAEYRADMSRFYIERVAILKNKIPVLLKAELEYKKAHELNPYNARYLVALAVVEEELFLIDTTKYSNRLESSVSHFREAYEKDSHHYIFNYDIGRNFLRIWDYIGEEDRRFSLARLKHCIELAPWYQWRIYPKLWTATRNFDALVEATPEDLKAYENLYSLLVKNNLWEFRKEVVNKIEKYKEREQPELFVQEKEEKKRLLRELELSQPLAGARGISSNIASSVTMTGSKVDWVGESKSGKSTYRNGNMYWTGTVHRAIDLPEGKSIIKIQAKGSPAYDIWPYMIVELDGEEIGETFVDSTRWKEYSFNVNSNGGVKVLSVTFPNDGGNLEKGIDRNLYVGETKVIKNDELE